MVKNAKDETETSEEHQQLREDVQHLFVVHVTCTDTKSISECILSVCGFFYLG